MRHMCWITVGIAGVSILLAGCQMNVITEFEPSGAGTLTTEVGMTPDEVTQVQTLGGGAEGSPCALFSSGQMGVANAPAFEEEKRGEDTWCVAAMPFADINELTGLYEEMDFVRIRELTLHEGLLVYDLELDTQGSDQGMTAAETTWVVVLPGKVGSHNADRVDGKRLTWTLGPGTVTEVQASSDLLAPSLPFSLSRTEASIIGAVLCACCGGVLLLVVVGVVLLLRRRRSEPASGAEPSGKSLGE
jgi:LppM domain